MQCLQNLSNLNNKKHLTFTKLRKIIFIFFNLNFILFKHLFTAPVDIIPKQTSPVRAPVISPNQDVTTLIFNSNTFQFNMTVFAFETILKNHHRSIQCAVLSVCVLNRKKRTGRDLKLSKSRCLMRN